MMKEIKEIILKLIQGITPKQAFIILILIIVFTAGYFITDRIYDHYERAEYVERRLNYLDSNIKAISNILQNKLLTEPIENP